MVKDNKEKILKDKIVVIIIKIEMEMYIKWRDDAFKLPLRRRFNVY